MTTHIWQGGAVAVKQITTITVGGTIASETFTLTIAGKDVAVTATGTETAAQIATALYNLLVSTTSPPNPEFREFSYADGGAGVITATGRTAGKPITMSGAATGSATLVVSDATAATGPNHLNNADNWSSGSVPTNSDTIEFRDGTTDVLYGLTALVAVTGLTINIREGFEAKIGLPEVNADSTAYPEYRQKYLQMAGGTINIDCSNLIRCRIDTRTTAATINVRNSGQREDANLPSIVFIGSHASNVANISRGDVGFAAIGGETAQIDILRESYVLNQANDAAVYLGAGVTLDECFKSGGTGRFDCGSTLIQTLPQSGKLILGGSGAHARLTIDGGTVEYNSSGTLTDFTVANDGYLDFDQDPVPKTSTNAGLVYGDKFNVRDTRGVCNSGVGPSLTFVRNSNYGRFLGPVNKTLTLS